MFEKEENHNTVDEDINALVAFRMRQLEEIDRAESIITTLGDLDESRLNPEDKKLIDDYRSGELDRKHEADLLLEAEKQDHELFAVVEAKRRADSMRRDFGGYEVDSSIKEYDGYKIGDRLNERGDVGNSIPIGLAELTFRLPKIVGFTPFELHSPGRFVNSEKPVPFAIIKFKDGSYETKSTLELSKRFDVIKLFSVV